MSQNVWSTINPATTSGTDLATLLDAFKNAIMSGLSGTTRPTQLTAGGFWVDTTNAGTPNYYYAVKFYDGVTDYEMFRVYQTGATGKASFGGANASFEVLKYSADTVGPVLQLVKRRVATNGQVLDGDTIGEIQFIGRTATSTNPMVGRIRMVASDDETSSAQGAYMVFEASVDAAAAATEMMRLVDGKLGIGTTSPEVALHVESATGIKSSHGSDDAVGPFVSVEKSRLATTGAVQTSDVLGGFHFRAKDSASAKFTTAKIEALALEGHTGSNKGTIVKISTMPTGTSSLSSRLEVGDKVESLATLKSTAREYVNQNVATAATIAQLSATTELVEMTGSTTTDIQGINSGQATKIITIHNRSSVDVTLKHENASATAADRMKLPGNVDRIVSAGNTAELYYCTTDTRWKLKSATSVPSVAAAAPVSVEALTANRTLSSTDDGKVFLVDTSTTAINITLYASTTNFSFIVMDKGFNASNKPITVIPAGAQKIQGLAANYVLEADGGYWRFVFDGTDWFKIS